MALAVVSKPTDRFFIHYDAKKIRPSSSRIALANQTYQCRDGDSQGFSRSLDCTLKSRKPMKSYRTPQELAYEYEVSEKTVIRWCRTGYLPSYKVGGRWRIEPNAELGNRPEVDKQIKEVVKSRGW